MSDERAVANVAPFLPDGRTRLFGIIGDPIVQVRSPASMTAQFRLRGKNAVLLPLHVAAEELDQVVVAIKAIQNFSGFIVTVPHKAAVLRHADMVPDDVRWIGAINVLRREATGLWRGNNFDGRGFLAGLIGSGYDPRGRSGYLIGCGGAGSAIAFALVDAGVARLRLHDRESDRARRLVASLSRLQGRQTELKIGADMSDEIDFVVNATPCGMDQDTSLPLDPSWLRPEMLVAEAVNKPELTPLLLYARQIGCQVRSGVLMSQGQTRLLRDFLLHDA